jgi:aryl-alcohol dehydrogenase-like predicted oxidoreductase
MSNPVKKLYQQQRIGLGCASISGEGGGYGFGDVSEDQAKELLMTAYDHGVRVFDTAPIYGFGLSEKRLG